MDVLEPLMRSLERHLAVLQAHLEQLRDHSLRQIGLLGVGVAEAQQAITQLRWEMVDRNRRR
jgi:hypothetical protein